MKHIKKITPFLSIASIACIITPLITSCSSKVSYIFDFTKHQQEIYRYKTNPIDEESGFEWTADEAIEYYFNGLESNKNNEKIKINGINDNQWILMDDIYNGLISEQEKISLVWYCGIWIENIDTQDHRLSLTWTVKYTLSDPMASSTIIVNTVKIKDIKFKATSSTTSPTGVKIYPESEENFLDTDDRWTINYTYEESSPLGLAKRTYIYNKELWKKFPSEPLLLVSENLNYNSRYLQNIKII